MKDVEIKNVDLEKMFIENGRIKDEYIIPDEEAEEYILDKVEEAKKLVRNFVKGTFGDESEKKLESLFERLPILVKRNLNTQERMLNFEKAMGGYIPEKKEINISQEVYEYYKDTSFFTSAIIHEIAHACSFEISKGEIGDETLITEEALADLFTEMCINYNLKNGVEIEDLKQFLKETEGKELYKMSGSSYSTYGFGDYIRCILYPARLENKDVDAIKEYFFGSKKEFTKILNESMDGKFENILEEINTNAREENIDINELVEGIIHKTINILYKQDKLYNEKSFSKDTDLEDGSLYPTETPYISLVYADYLVNEELKKQNDLNKKSPEELEEFFNNVAETVGNRYQLYGNTFFMNSLTKRWYENTDKNLEKFNTILDLADRLPKELILEIAEDQGFSEDMDVLKYMELVDDYIGITPPETELIEYMMDNCNKKLSPEEKYEIFGMICETANHPIITDETAQYLSNLDLDEKQQNDMYKFFYHPDEEEGLNKLIKILDDKQILDSEVTEENRDLINTLLIEIKKAKPNWKIFEGEQNTNYELDENNKAKLTPNNMILLTINKKKQIIEMFDEMNITEYVRNKFFEESYQYNDNTVEDLTEEDLINILVNEGYMMVEFWYEDDNPENVEDYIEEDVLEEMKKVVEEGIEIGDE